jgi:membrane fusion protein, multidrug efflux system
MDNKTIETEAQATPTQNGVKPGIKRWSGLAALVLLVGVAALVGPRLFHDAPAHAASSMAPVVTVSRPLQKDIHGRLQLLGQFSAVDRVELRAQVGGTLTYIGFKDGDIVRKGALLFIIDPTPYEIRLDQTTAQVASAKARLELASQELTRAQTLQED